MNDQRKLDPRAHFAAPGQVLEATDLSVPDKVEILDNWANELRQAQVAEEENMPAPAGASVADQLAAVEQALQALGHAAHHDAKA